MIANGIDILKTYDAILTGRDIQACNIVTFDEWLDDSFDPRVNKQKEGYSAITVKLLVEGANEDDVLLKTSNIINICKKGELKFSDFNFSYNISLEKHQEKLISEILYELTLNFKSTFKLSDEITINMNRETSKNINVEGNIKTPCIIEITPLLDTIDITISGLNDDIVIKNLKVNKKIIINSLEGTVLEDGINKFADTDFWEFPYLLPGVNTIKINKDTCNINVKYKNRYI
ncbi:TPA: phage tail family protein [Clostridium perfringens]|uniref:phage distal tail protein n=1 Tax=Clostridium perfringens TaxID=1502 RepID=UPI0018AB148D|nr:phage tail family protein [Clostridium perfringens]EHR1328796.1 phage tail family protein [Clostridium perfringens]EHR1331929.1 phage tail family protein [Clostridium perfringens]EHR1425406.1 phage tail family protein [Clostridium perfringens]EIF2086686.1 phage tail family protein [Clostridium perfringens]EIF6165323.1 phage tail family protein [Clostridium perfringens]